MIFSLLAHLSQIMALVHAVQEVFSFVAKNKAMPPQESMKKMLDAVEALLDSGVIQVPGVDDAKISEALKLIEAEMYPDAPKP